MLNILGHYSSLCHRREALQVGALSLFAGMSAPRLLKAAAHTSASFDGTAKSVILINLFGGPPHQDLFDLKPEAPK